jgi:DNA polymerase III alpha subunit
MRLDQFSNPIFNESDLFNALYKGYQFSVDDTLLVEERTDNICQLEQQLGFKFLNSQETHFELKDYDHACQQVWNMPDEYKVMDIEEYLVQICPKEDYQRLVEELQEYSNRDMLNLLRWLKYFVDTMRQNNIVWGVGRGSSVSSYVLFLIGVHKINSIKHNLDWREFLR